MRGYGKGIQSSIAGIFPFQQGLFRFKDTRFLLECTLYWRRSASALHTLRSSQPFRRCIMGSRLLGGFLPSSPISFQTFVRFASTYTATVGVCLAARECRLRRLVRRGAGIQSSVYLQLIGKDGKSDIMEIAPPNGVSFSRGSSVVVPLNGEAGPGRVDPRPCGTHEHWNGIGMVVTEHRRGERKEDQVVVSMWSLHRRSRRHLVVLFPIHNA